MTISKPDLEITSQTTDIVDDIADWQPPMPPTDLIFDDGEPLESNRHRIAMNVLIRSLQQAWADRNDFYTGGNMFIYYSSTQARNNDFRGPDFFAVLNVDGTIPRQGWVVWEENGRYPDVIVELMSPSTARVDKVTKKEIYQQTFRTPDYFVYDPFDPNSLQGWHLDANQNYQPLTANERGWLWCQRLGLWLGTWEGTVDRETAIWLRFYDTDGNLVPLPEEAAQAQAEAAQAQAETAQAQAEAAQAQAEAAQAQAEAAQAQAQAAQARAERLAARLRELGEDPDA
ncbi:Uma2 family endonuclease [Nostoc sp. FACHB-110]|uniref:Uma2 family endonuclease n=1 Tax=Nostoc sp. FACHB-110 TaxID=2692834 RepID=UPI0016884B95|nr:Uma2 family endonuclease [Nostoc sp. FACHB-110]MBD2437117.1 Uma2 family endonuclease [Nostoc sp. FACHB-110]